MNTRTKMYRTNSKIKKHLIGLGFHHFYLFPHSRFSKDYHFKDMPFDAIGFRDKDKSLYLFQFKTNCGCPKSVLEQYKKIQDEYYVKCWWVNAIDGGKIKCYFPDDTPTEI